MKPSLQQLFSVADDGELVIGIYLYPYSLFGTPDWADDCAGAEIVAELSVMGKTVPFTCNGGLFLRPPTGLAAHPVSAPGWFEGLAARIEFQEGAAHVFNRIICEFALHGVVSEPATPVHISPGRLIGKHALVRSCGGGREVYTKRALDPGTHLIQGTWRTYAHRGIEVVETVARQECVARLAEASEHLPALVAGAYSLFSQRQLAEAIVDSGIVIEQLIDFMWADYVSRIADKARRERLNDTRTYTAAVRTEVFHSTGRIEENLYRQLNSARKHRNEVAHRARATLAMADETTSAMRALVEMFCRRAVAPLNTYQGVGW